MLANLYYTLFPVKTYRKIMVDAASDFIIHSARKADPVAHEAAKRIWNEVKYTTAQIATDDDWKLYNEWAATNGRITVKKYHRRRK